MSFHLIPFNPVFPLPTTSINLEQIQSMKISDSFNLKSFSMYIHFALLFHHHPYQVVQIQYYSRSHNRSRVLFRQADNPLFSLTFVFMRGNRELFILLFQLQIAVVILWPFQQNQSPKGRNKPELYTEDPITFEYEYNSFREG